ncbi:MAG: DUF2237 domain-containing protein [Acidobacteria bacterium]|jgi:uncharacterized protein (DUF2237 family)|nr:DUF2237 domain-containing protein [Acidobacteriota bacterium]
MSITNGNGHRPKPKNVLGGELKCCCMKPLTGFYRDGFCKTGADDRGSHTICVRVTDEFLAFSKSRGNDLSTPRPEFQFPGLKDGDKWCLVAMRWQEALEAGAAPEVILEATHEAALQYVLLEDLQKYQVE